jgi:hypothetical protein
MSTAQNFPRLGTIGDGESDFGPFVASRKGLKFHRPDCEWAACISPWNMETYSSHTEAVQSGKKPCGTCKA